MSDMAKILREFQEIQRMQVPGEKTRAGSQSSSTQQIWSSDGRYQLRIHSVPQEDRIEKYYEVWDGEKPLKNLDWTSFEDITPEDFDLWIALGMPDRRGGYPLDPEQLKALAQERGLGTSNQEVTEDMLIRKLREKFARQVAGLFSKPEKTSKGPESQDH